MHRREGRLIAVTWYAGVGSWGRTGDGVVVKDQRVKLYTAVVADDLQENIAREQGEYLSS